MESLHYLPLQEGNLDAFANRAGVFFGQKTVGSLDKPYETAALRTAHTVALQGKLDGFSEGKPITGLVVETVYYEDGSSILDLPVTDDEVDVQPSAEYPGWIEYVAETATGNIEVHLNRETSEVRVLAQHPDIFGVVIGFKIGY